MKEDHKTEAFIQYVTTSGTREGLDVIQLPMEETGELFRTLFFVRANVKYWKTDEILTLVLSYEEDMSAELKKRILTFVATMAERRGGIAVTVQKIVKQYFDKIA
jgi:hypothetical protein